MYCNKSVEFRSVKFYLCAWGAELINYHIRVRRIKSWAFETGLNQSWLHACSLNPNLSCNSISIISGWGWNRANVRMSIFLLINAHIFYFLLLRKCLMSIFLKFFLSIFFCPPYFSVPYLLYMILSYSPHRTNLRTNHAILLKLLYKPIQCTLLH